MNYSLRCPKQVGPPRGSLGIEHNKFRSIAGSHAGYCFGVSPLEDRPFSTFTGECRARSWEPDSWTRGLPSPLAAVFMHTPSSPWPRHCLHKGRWREGWEWARSWMAGRYCPEGHVWLISNGCLQGHAGRLLKFRLTFGRKNAMTN